MDGEFGGVHRKKRIQVFCDNQISTEVPRMPTDSRPTKNTPRVDSSVTLESSEPSGEVHTYVEEAMKSLPDFVKVNPLGNYGRPIHPSYDADRESKECHIRKLSSLLEIIPAHCCANTSIRNPELLLDDRVFLVNMPAPSRIYYSDS